MNTVLGLSKKTNQIIVVAILSVLAGWGSIFISARHLFLYVLCLCVAVVGLFVLKRYADHFSWRAAFLQLLAVSAFIGPGFFSIHVGGFSLFPFRLILVLMFVYAVYDLPIWNRYDSISFNIQVKFIALFFCVWILYAFLSLFWVDSLTYGVKDFLLLTSGILVILFFLVIFNKMENYFHFYYIWIVMFGFLILIGLWNHFTLKALPISRVYGGSAALRAIPTAVFTNENDFSSFLSISILLILPWIRYTKKILFKLIGIILLLCAFYLIVLDSSRANMLAVLIGLVFWFLAYTDNWQKLKTLYGAIVILPFVIGIFHHKVLSLLGRVVSQLDSLFVSHASTGSVSTRMNLLKDAESFFTNTYGLGVGAGNAPFYLKHYAIFNTNGITNIHNWWAEILVDYGLGIFICFVLVYITLIVYMFKISRVVKDSKEKMVSEGLFCGLIVYFLACMSPSSFIGLEYNWLFLAFCVGFVNIRYHQLFHPRRIKHSE